MVFELELSLVVGLVGVGIAILQRAWKTFLEAKKVDPNLKFDSTYLLNTLVSTGFATTIVTVIIPGLIATIKTTGIDMSATISITAMLVNFGLGWGITYSVLDSMNTSTEKKLQIVDLQKQVDAATTTTTTTPTTPS